MILYERTNSDNNDFHKLIKELDADLQIRDGDEHPFFAQFNKIDMIKYVVIAYENDEAVGCGAIKHYSENFMEVKRMYVSVNKRGLGIATNILKHLEKWAVELNYTTCLLETGKKQTEAVALYLKNKYSIIPNFGQYKEVESSICFEKKLVAI